MEFSRTSASAPEPPPVDFGSVLITGSSGRIGSMLVPRLIAHGWQLRLCDLRSNDRPVEGEPPTFIGDITDPATLDEVLHPDETGAVTAIVHLAGRPTEDVWSRIQSANIDSTFQVFEAARRAGVPRVLFASSIHAVGFATYETDRPAASEARPDTLYGVSKIFGEALGRYYVDRYSMQVACLRIGTCEERPPDRRALATWLSPDDCARLVDATLRAPALTYATVWGISANSSGFFSQAEGQALGYVAQDNADDYANQLTDPVSPYELAPSDHLLGGGFTTEGFGIDAVRSRSQ